MKNLARIRWAMFWLAASSGSAAALFVGCASDDTAILLSGEDASADTSTQGPPIRPDAAGNTDADDEEDLDGSTGPDAFPDVDFDAADTSFFDVGAPNFEEFAAQVNQLFCRKYASCCGPNEFDLERCEKTHISTIANDLSHMVAPHIDGGHLVLDPATANQCFEAIRAAGCGSTTAQVVKGMATNCALGIVGTLPQSAFGCRGSAECAPPNHCDIGEGTDVGVCNPPRPTGSACSPGERVRNDAGAFASRGRRFRYEPQAQCGTLNTGDPGYCGNGDTRVGTLLESTDYECQAPASLDAGCRTNLECQSGLCLPNDGRNSCTTEGLFLSPAVCETFKRPVDAGTDADAQP